MKESMTGVKRYKKEKYVESKDYKHKAKCAMCAICCHYNPSIHLRRD